jgi:hypothetical protein
MGQRYLTDTNVLIDAQMNRLPQKGLDFLAKVINERFKQREQRQNGY